MKKSLIALLSVTILLLFVASAFALHAVPENFEYTPSIVKSKMAQIELGGEIRIRGYYENNTSDFASIEDRTTPETATEAVESNDDQNAYYDQRVRLHVKATVSPNTMGMVELETGDSANNTYKWGNVCDDAHGEYPKSNCKPEDLVVRQAYIAHQGNGLGMLSGFKAGHMLLALGNGMFYNHTEYGDDAIVLWMAPVEGTEISLVTIKIGESATAGMTRDDANAYVLMAESAIDSVNVSGDVTYVSDNETSSAAGLTLWNIGVRGDADLGIASIKGDVEFQAGKIKEALTDGSDMDLRAWALLLGADFKLGEVNLGTEFAYGSGDDIDSEDKYEGFITSLSDGQRSTFIADYRAPGAGQHINTGGVVSSTYAGMKNYGLNNQWYINVGADAKVHPDVKVGGDIYYLRASQKVANDTPGTEQDLEDLNMGVEVDAKVVYQIDQNLVYFIEGGYLFAGDFYKNVTRGKDADHYGDADFSSDPDNAYAVRHGLILSF
jgi:hypothetical protein